jgi:hypothetical protein
MDMHYYFFFVRYSREKVFRKKNRDNYKGKSKNSGKLQKLSFLYAFSIITDDRNDIYLINSFFLFDMPRDGNNSIESF